MNAQVVISETRSVCGFDRVVLKAQHDNEVIITQGDREGLTIQGPPDVVPRIETQVRHGTLTVDLDGGWLARLGDALTTSLTRPRIRYELAVKDLSGLDVRALASVRADSLKAEKLAIRFSGVGDLRVGAVDVHTLEVELLGAARIELSGSAAEQRVTVGGPAQYDAAGLRSRRAEVAVNGVGSATVRAAKELDVSVRGPGRVSYYGTPRVTHRLAPLGQLSCLGPA